VAALAPSIAPYGLNQQIADDARQPPSRLHYFGTDHLGRDVFSRVVLGTREVLALAGSGSLIAVILGTTFGLVAGYLGGVVDELLMRLFDSLLAIPALLLALLLLGTIGSSTLSVIIVIVVIYTPIVTRVARSVVISVRSMAFVEVAQTQGEPLHQILFGEILPSVVPAMAVEASMRFSYAIFLIASLGFLGIGVQPPSPNWGLMVNEARDFVRQTPWALYVPSGAIALLVIGVNLMADGLKRALQRS
jgi:peptide/nickel transport system permease protein